MDTFLFTILKSQGTTCQKPTFPNDRHFVKKKKAPKINTELLHFFQIKGVKLYICICRCICPLADSVPDVANPDVFVLLGCSMEFIHLRR